MGLLSNHALDGWLLIAYGLVSIFFPSTVFFWEWWDRGWGWNRYGGGEEAPAAVLFVIRAIGVFALIAGVALLLGRSVPWLHAVLPF